MWNPLEDFISNIEAKAFSQMESCFYLSLFIRGDVVRRQAVVVLILADVCCKFGIILKTPLPEVLNDFVEIRSYIPY